MASFVCPCRHCGCGCEQLRRCGRHTRGGGAAAAAVASTATVVFGGDDDGDDDDNGGGSSDAVNHDIVDVDETATSLCANCRSLCCEYDDGFPFEKVGLRRLQFVGIVSGSQMLQVHRKEAVKHVPRSAAATTGSTSGHRHLNAPEFQDC